MKVQFFGRLADHGGREIEVAVPDAGCSLAELVARIAASDPTLGAALAAPGVRACAGRDFLDADHHLTTDASIEFWPPVSGG